MSHLNFFNDFKETFESLENQAHTGHLVQMRQMIAQLHVALDKYKLLINDVFNLLWDKKNRYDQILADNINCPPLTAEHYKQVNKQLKQFSCDINALSQLIKQVNPKVTIFDYENRLSALNKHINRACSSHWKR